MHEKDLNYLLALVSTLIYGEFKGIGARVHRGVHKERQRGCHRDEKNQRRIVQNKNKRDSLAKYFL